MSDAVMDCRDKALSLKHGSCGIVHDLINYVVSINGGLFYRSISYIKLIASRHDIVTGQYDLMARALAFPRKLVT